MGPARAAIVCALLVAAPPAFAKKAPRAAPAAASDAKHLGRGVRALWAGDFAAAGKELRPLVERPKLGSVEHARYALAQAELLDGEATLAQGHFAKVATSSSRFAAVARARQADAAWALRRGDEARRLYEAALAHPSPDVDAAVCRFRIAEIAEARDPKRAVALYRDVHVQHPMHPLARVAWDKVRALDPEAEPTVAERIQRAKIMTNSRGWPLAIEELKRLPPDLPAAERDEADYWYGTTLFHMRREYDVAAQKLLGVWSRLPGEERRAEALFHGARAKSRADLDDEAIAGYRELLERFPRCKNAAEASFLVGWLDFNRARYKEAIPALEETLKRFGGGAFATDARWYLGLSRWLAGDAVGALADFGRLAQGRGDLAAGKGAYWQALALDKLGKKDAALAAWRTLARERPFTFYALLARVRLGERGVALDPFGREEPGPDEDRDPPGAVDEAVARDPIVQRADELLAAELPVEASVELQRGEVELLRRYGAGRALPVLFDRYGRGEDFHRIHRLAEAHAGRALAVDPRRAPGARAWWELVYPRAYRAFVEKYGPTGKNPPEYLYTIMQKESAYDPHDVSYADAIGLLQMIPPTSRRVAEHVGVPYTDDVLYDPEGNIRFGAWYIGGLLQKFKGQIAIGAGSYNAGPKAMTKWLDKHGARPLDEFIELCPYAQTREYMKKALAIYARYVYLYDGEDYLPALAIDAKYVTDDGIDY